MRWRIGVGPVAGALVADHVNGNKHDNSIANLVPACQSCNGTRTSRRVRDDEPFVERADGARFRAFDRTCETCGAQFRAIKAQVANGKGRFCSRSCARKSARG